MTAAAILLAGVGCLAAFSGWVLPRPAVAAIASSAALAGAVAFALLDPEPVAPATRALLLVVAALLAMLGGGPVASAVFVAVDRDRVEGGASTQNAAEVLRGGAWIGVLERAAIYTTIVVGWPSGLAVLLALKGLGRYPELRVQEDSGAAERFIIGTLASALWAVACAGLAWSV